MTTRPICAHCGKTWPSFKGGTEDISPELEAEINAHMLECDKNPLIVKIKELEYIIKEFGEWYSDNGCPATETKEGFCPDLDGYRARHEEQNLEEAEEDRFEFDSSDCETQINCGKCFAEYYRMKYKEQNK